MSPTSLSPVQHRSFCTAWARRFSEECHSGANAARSVGSVACMTIGILVAGLIALLGLLVAVGAFGGVGSVELALWLVLVVAWIVVWFVSRRARRTSP